MEQKSEEKTVHSWEIVEKKVKDAIELIKKLSLENEELKKKVVALETELNAVHALRLDRDALKSEKEAVKRRVKEMLLQLDKIQL